MTSPHGHRLLQLPPLHLPLPPASPHGRLLLLALQRPPRDSPSRRGHRHRLLTPARLLLVTGLSRQQAPDLQLLRSLPGLHPRLVAAASARNLQRLAPYGTPGRLGPHVPRRKAHRAAVTTLAAKTAPSSSKTLTLRAGSSACPSPTMQHRHRQRKTTLRLLLRATTLP